MIKISQQEYARRRKIFLALLPENSIAVIPATPVQHKTADSDYLYHPNTNLYYLTGYREPNCVAVFIPDRPEGSFILFNLPKNRTEEIWRGIRVGQIAAVSDFGVNQAFVIDELSQRIVELMQGKKQLYYSLGRNPEYDDIILNTISQLKARVRAGVAWPTEIIDVDTMINQMRVIKSPAEIEMMRYVCKVSVEAHKAAMKRAKPGLNEYHIHAELLYNFINKEKSKNCPGGACEIRHKDKIQTFNLAQKIIVIFFALLVTYGMYAYMTKVENKTLLMKKVTLMMMSDVELKALKEKQMQEEFDKADF